VDECDFELHVNEIDGVEEIVYENVGVPDAAIE
jgi:hypothetical protein